MDTEGQFSTLTRMYWVGSKSSYGENLNKLLANPIPKLCKDQKSVIPKSEKLSCRTRYATETGFYQAIFSQTRLF